MRAYYLEQSDKPVDTTGLEHEGILTWLLPLDPSGYGPPLEAIRKQRGYVEMDEIHLSPDTPDIEALCAKFFDEHRHTDEEIRFVVAGGGIFDIRDQTDRWMRIHVAAGDLVVIPANKYHRFTLDKRRTITCKRLFKDTNGWAPVPRGLDLTD
jgi:1,2-dihydroxy-3-keto-5-methylthiopentene dioxygenase